MRLKLVSLLTVFSVLGLAQESFFLKDGDRVVFYGDSITDARLYTTFAETFVVTRFPKLNVSFVHSGWGGDRVSGGGGGPIDARLWRDVLPYNPSVVTIMLGMNDGRVRAFDQAIFDEFTNGYKHIVETLKRQFPSMRITAIQPSAYDDVTRAPTFEGGYNAVLVRYSDFLKTYADAEKLSVADLNTPVVNLLKRANDLDAAAAARLVPDRVHPTAAGHLVMAAALLKAWNAPSLVSETEIDAARKSVTRQTGTKVSDLAGGRGVSWTQLDDGLPMPINMQDALTVLTVKSSDVVTLLNQQPLRVRGLAAGKYALKIDGETAGSFTHLQLADGVNLADLAGYQTPMQRQAAAVHALTLRHNNLHATRWRQVQVPNEKESSPQLLRALTALDELEMEIIKNQRATAQPQAHRFDVVPE
jgi:lysophospholipase L1-like esterase